VSLTAAPPPRAGAGPTAVGPAGAGPAAAGPTTAGRAGGSRRSTPSVLVRLRALASATVLVAGLAGALVLVLGWAANRSAADDTEQLIRAQTIKTELLRADAIATSSFLVGGLESPAARTAYDDALATVSEQVTAAALAQPADQRVLSRLNASVLDYASTMELARANNRQGLPVGSAYLQQASSDLRATVLPLADALVTANADRATSSMASQHPVPIALPGLLALAVLVLVNRWVSRRFRRRVNLGLAVAALALTVATVAGVVVAAAKAGDNATVRAQSYRSVVDGAAARTAANDAKSDESLRLIARGSGQGFEQAWTAAEAVVARDLPAGGDAAARTQWQAYVTVHARIVALDDAGSWDAAVALATSGADSSTQRFDTFDATMAALVADAGARTTSALRSGGWTFLVVAGLDVLLGLVAAAAAWRGLSTRLEEYA